MVTNSHILAWKIEILHSEILGNNPTSRHHIPCTGRIRETINIVHQINRFRKIIIWLFPQMSKKLLIKTHHTEKFMSDFLIC